MSQFLGENTTTNFEDFILQPKPAFPSLPNIRLYADLSLGAMAAINSKGVNTLGGGITGASQTVVNVKNPLFAGGAKGDTQSSNVGVVTNGSPLVNCANCAFTSADVGKSASVTVSLGIGPAFAGNPTILSVNSPTQITLSANSGQNITGFLVWGHDDTAAILAAAASFYANLKDSIPQSDNYLGPVVSVPPTLYFPAGNYLVCNLPSGLINIPTSVGWKVLGDGQQVSVISLCGRPTVPSSNTGILLNIQGNTQSGLVQGLTFNATFSTNANGCPTVQITGSQNNFRDVICTKSIQTCLSMTGTGTQFQNVAANQSFINIVCSGCTDTDFYSSGASNGNSNLLIQGAFGPGNNAGVRIFGGFWDECGSPPCQRVINSSDVYWIGSTIAGLTTALSVDANSYVHLMGTAILPFAQDNNSTGITIAAGGTVEATDCRIISTGTGQCINNSGNFINNGNVTCESQFITTTSASAGTTATLTATTLGANVNTNCSVGDTITVVNNSVAGYNGVFLNGVTATTATTISYLTQGSNIGAGSGGFFFCRNNQSFSGNLPISTLTHTWNTCNDTLAAFTGGVLCNQFLDQPLNVFHVKASSMATTACTVAPVVTLTDGTITQTLTITTGKSSWDSAVDAVTGFPAVPVKGTNDYKRGGTITVSVTTGTCTTPPTNFSVTYNAQSIFDN